MTAPSGNDGSADAAPGSVAAAIPDTNMPSTSRRECSIARGSILVSMALLLAWLLGAPEPISGSNRRGILGSPARFRIQNPCPVGEGDIDALLPERGAEFGRELVQHPLDGGVGQVAKIGMDCFAGEHRHRFAVRTDRAVRARPCVSDFRAGEHARQGG